MDPLTMFSCTFRHDTTLQQHRLLSVTANVTEPSGERTSMRRHCLSRPTWRSLCGERNYSVLRAMLLFALVVSLLSSDSVHRMRSVFSGSTKVLLSSERSFLLEGWTKFAWRSHLMLDPKRIRAREAVLSLPSGSSRFRSSPPL